MNIEYVKSENIPTPTADQVKAAALWDQSFEEGHLSEGGLLEIAQLLQVPVNGDKQDVVDGIHRAFGELNFRQLCQDEQIAVAQLGLEIEGYYVENDGVNKYLKGYRIDGEDYLFDTVEYQQFQEDLEEVWN